MGHPLLDDAEVDLSLSAPPLFVSLLHQAHINAKVTSLHGSRAPQAAFGTVREWTGSARRTLNFDEAFAGLGEVWSCSEDFGF